MLALVLDGEAPLVPDVGEALAAARLLDPLLEGVELAGRVGLRGLGGAEHLAEVQEVLLVGRPLRERGLAPPLREGLWGKSGHGRMLPTSRCAGQNAPRQETSRNVGCAYCKAILRTSSHLYAEHYILR